eukprot:TRINITY_DN22794_c0_g1_i1.p1 TRINITY_DN22794_c0_g1~~TRINITY_DN22794_c0_g1_i1.p1  ORF type:complete len:377 (-),score=40.59 TRINITY_DN22794_c0_g1_i1:206-1336(-)
MLGLLTLILGLIHVDSESRATVSPFSAIVEDDSDVDRQACSLLQHSSGAAVASGSSRDRKGATNNSETDLQKLPEDWEWTKCIESEEDLATCCKEFAGSSKDVFFPHLREVLLVSPPRTATQDLQISMDLWLHCRGLLDRTERLNTAEFPTVDFPKKDFDKLGCHQKGGCLIMTTFRTPVAMMVSMYLYNSCSDKTSVKIKTAFTGMTSTCEEVLDMKEKYLLLHFFEWVGNFLKGDLAKKLRRYYHTVANWLESNGYAASEALDEGHYQSWQGRLKLEVRSKVSGGMPLRWLLLSFDSMVSWGEIIAKDLEAPGFQLLNKVDIEDKIPLHLQEKYDRQSWILMNRLKDDLAWPIEHLRELTSWDVVEFFYPTGLW